MEWALLRLHGAATAGALAPVRITLLLNGDDGPWHNDINGWDRQLIAAAGARQAAMLDTLRARVAQLVRWWQQAQAQPMRYFARTSWVRSEEHTSELQSLMRISYAVFCLKKKTNHNNK